MKEKWGVEQKNLGEWSKKSWVDGKKYQMIHAKHRSWHPKTVNLKTFCPKLTFKNRYITSKNGSIGQLFVTPPLSEIGKKIGKMLKYTSHFQSSFGTAVYSVHCTVYTVYSTLYSIHCTLYSIHHRPLKWGSMIYTVLMVYSVH